MLSWIIHTSCNQRVSSDLLHIKFLDLPRDGHRGRRLRAALSTVEKVADGSRSPKFLYGSRARHCSISCARCSAGKGMHAVSNQGPANPAQLLCSVPASVLLCNQRPGDGTA